MNLKRNKKIETLFQEIITLMLTIVDLKHEVRRTNSKLEGMDKYVCMLDSRLDNLDSILSIGTHATTKLKELDI